MTTHHICKIFEKRLKKMMLSWIRDIPSHAAVKHYEISVSFVKRKETKFQTLFMLRIKLQHDELCSLVVSG